MKFSIWSMIATMKICLVGLGIIGNAWSEHYLKDGYDLKAWNRTPKELPCFEPDLIKAAASSEIIHIVISDPSAVQGVMDIILPALAPGSLVIQSSTVSPKAGQAFHDQVVSRGCDYVEAPFTGSKPAAEMRQNVFYMGGEPGPVAKAQSILKSLSKRMAHVGTVQQACAIKLAMNLQIAAMSQALSESLHFSRSYGIQDDTYFDLLNDNVAKSGFSELKKPKLLAGDFSPQFSVKHMHKDIRLATESVSPSQLPLTRKVVDIYQQGLDAGLGDDDFSGLIRLLEMPHGTA